MGSLPRPAASNEESTAPAKVQRTNARGRFFVMSKLAWMVGGLCAAAVCFLALGSRRTPKVDDLAHQLEGAWADHHTTV